MKQARKLWLIDAVDKRGKDPREGQLYVLAKNLLESLAKAQTFLDEKYGKRKFEVKAGEFQGTIDIF